MKFLTITAIDDPYLSFVKKLYHAAFPKEERRDWQQLIDMVDTAGEMWLQVIEEDGIAIGFITFWMLEQWCFLEHFAIEPSLRGKRYGERIMKELMKHDSVLLEVEPPYTENAIRRIGFYERLGFSILPFPYRQPSYHHPEESFSMCLMSNSSENTADKFSEIISLVRSRVYSCSNK